MKKLLILLCCYNCDAQTVKYDTAAIIKLQSGIKVIAAYKLSPGSESVLIVKKRTQFVAKDVYGLHSSLLLVYLLSTIKIWKFVNS